MNEHTRRHIQMGCGTPRVCRRAQGRHVRRRAEQSAWHAVGEQIASLLAFVNKTYSETARSNSPRAIRSGADRAVQFAVRPARPRAPDERLSQDGGIADERAAAGGDRQTVPASYSDRVRKIGVVNTRNKVLTKIAATLMDGRRVAQLHDRQFRGRGFTFDQ